MFVPDLCPFSNASNQLWASDTIRRQSSRSTFVQIMAWRLTYADIFSIKLLGTVISGPWMKVEHFISWKCVWQCYFQYDDHFVQASMCFNTIWYHFRGFLFIYIFPSLSSLPWIFPVAPPKVNGSPGNIQDNLTSLVFHHLSFGIRWPFCLWWRKSARASLASYASLTWL